MGEKKPEYKANIYALIRSSSKEEWGQLGGWNTEAYSYVCFLATCVSVTGPVVIAMLSCRRHRCLW